jgi:subtilisin family serine protease
VIVVVIDSGIDLGHPALLPKLWENQAEKTGQPNADEDRNGYNDDVHGHNFLALRAPVRSTAPPPEPAAPPDDDFGHGTHVAGIIAAAQTSRYPVQGVAGALPNVRLMALKILDADGHGDLPIATVAIKYATAVKTKLGSNVHMIINASWATSRGANPAQQDQIDKLRDAITRAEAEGILFVTVAGNDANGGQSLDRLVAASQIYPACFSAAKSVGLALNSPDMITVCATDRAEKFAAYSNFGSDQVHIAAPGGTGGNGGIKSTYPRAKGGSKYLSGTSMSAAFVSGVAAYVWSHPAHQNDLAPEIRKFLFDTSRALPSLANPDRCETRGVVSLQALGGTCAPPGLSDGSPIPRCPLCDTPIGGEMFCLPKGREVPPLQPGWLPDGLSPIH